MQKQTKTDTFVNTNIDTIIGKKYVSILQYVLIFAIIVSIFTLKHYNVCF